MDDGYTIMIATHREPLEKGAVLHLQDHPVQVVRGNQFPSCSRLWNECIARCPTERVIICNEKARPSKETVAKLNSLLDSGFAFAGLYLYGFFGFDKELIRKIGFFDERYLGGWFEDNDFCLRIWEANLAAYYSHECDYIQMPSSWKHEEATKHFQMKWGSNPFVRPIITPHRLLGEEQYDYHLGDSVPRNYLTKDYSVIIDRYRWMYQS